MAQQVGQNPRVKVMNKIIKQLDKAIKVAKANS